jgi:hypothetical protein
MSYGVLWSEDGEAAYPGRLEVGPDRLVLEGALCGRAQRAELSPGEIQSVRVGRTKNDRLGGLAVLVVERAGGSQVRVAPIGAVGLLHELLDVVNALRGDAPL